MEIKPWLKILGCSQDKNNRDYKTVKENEDKVFVIIHYQKKLATIKEISH